jgi:hypothetical protein
MTNPSSSSPSLNTSTRADIVFTFTVAVVMVLALIGTFEWPTKAAIFPRVVIVAGIVFSLGLGVILVWKRFRHATAHPVDATVGSQGVQAPSDNQNDDAEYVFATAGRRAWNTALLWIVFFLVLTAVTGIFVSSGLFALLYLRFGAGKSWKFSLIYSTVLSICLLAMFRWLLYIPTPLGILTGF